MQQISIRKLQITQEMIGSGVKNNCLRCPVALAFSATGLLGVSVGRERAYGYGDGGKVVLFVLGFAAKCFIERFDEDAEVAPMEIEVRQVDKEEYARFI